MRRYAWLVVVALVTGCGSEEEAPEGTAEVTSRAHPVALRAVAATIEALEGGLLEDGPLRRRVAAVAAEVAEAAQVEVASVAVLDTPEVIARLVPGGHLQVSRGLLDAVRGDVEGDATRGEERLAAIVGLALVSEWRWPQVAPVASSTVGRIVAGDGAVGEDAAGLGRAVVDARRARATSSPLLKDVAGSFARFDRAAALLARLGVEPRALPAAARALVLGAGLDPRRVEAFLDTHGDLAALGPAIEQAASAAGPPRERAERLHELDARPLAQGTLLDAAELLARRGQPQRAAELAAGLAGARAAYVRGLALAARGDAEGADGAAHARDAERQLRTALVLDAGHVPARLLLGRLYAAQGRREAAREELLEVVRRAPLLAEAHLLLGLAQDAEEPRRARLELARALDPLGLAGQQAAAALATPARSGPAPLDPRRRRLFGAGSER